MTVRTLLVCVITAILASQAEPSDADPRSVSDQHHGVPIYISVNFEGSDSLRSKFSELKYRLNADLASSLNSALLKYWVVDPVAVDKNRGYILKLTVTVRNKQAYLAADLYLEGEFIEGLPQEELWDWTGFYEIAWNPDLDQAYAYVVSAIRERALGRDGEPRFSKGLKDLVEKQVPLARGGAWIDQSMAVLPLPWSGYKDLRFSRFLLSCNSKDSQENVELQVPVLGIGRVETHPPLGGKEAYQALAAKVENQDERGGVVMVPAGTNSASLKVDRLERVADESEARLAQSTAGSRQIIREASPGLRLSRPKFVFLDEVFESRFVN